MTEFEKRAEETLRKILSHRNRSPVVEAWVLVQPIAQALADTRREALRDALKECEESNLIGTCRIRIKYLLTQPERESVRETSGKIREWVSHEGCDYMGPIGLACRECGQVVKGPTQRSYTDADVEMLVNSARALLAQYVGFKRGPLDRALAPFTKKGGS